MNQKIMITFLIAAGISCLIGAAYMLNVPRADAASESQPEDRSARVTMQIIRKASGERRTRYFVEIYMDHPGWNIASCYDTAESAKQMRDIINMKFKHDEIIKDEVIP